MSGKSWLAIKSAILAHKFSVYTLLFCFFLVCFTIGNMHGGHGAWGLFCGNLLSLFNLYQLLNPFECLDGGSSMQVMITLIGLTNIREYPADFF